MKRKTILILILLGIFTFTFDNKKCKAYCPDGDVCTSATGEPVDGTGATTNKNATTTWEDSGSIITITPTEGSGLKGTELKFTDSELEKLGMEPTTVNGNTNKAHASAWKQEILGLPNILNNGDEPSEFQRTVLEKMAEAQEPSMSYEEFVEEYKKTALENNSAFTYDDKQYARVCTTDYTKCGDYTDKAACTAALGDAWGCYGVTIAQRACGKEECTGDDEGKIKKAESCLESGKSEYECCVEAFGKEACSGSSSGGGGGGSSSTSCGSVPEATIIESRTLPLDSSSGSISCGNTYTTVTYSTGATACEYIKTLIEYTYTETYPSVPSNYDVGEKINFSNTVHWQSVTTEEVWDDSELLNEIAIAQNIIDRIDAEVDCLQEQIDKLEKMVSECEKGIDECEKACTACENACPDDDDDDDDSTSNTSSTCDCDCNCGSYDDCSRDDEIKPLEEEIEGLLNSSEYLGAKERLKELEECGSRGYAFSSTTRSLSGSYSLGNSYLKLDNYTQVINSIKGIAKNSGKLLTQSDLSNFKNPFFENNSSFVIPVETKKGTKGEVVAVTNSGSKLYSCPINVNNLFTCGEKDCSSGINVIYRPISLTDPFPNANSNEKYRAMGANWNEYYAQSVIENNRGVSDYDVYNLTPIYTIVLTPTDIKEIREYNKTVSYNNFDMDCSNGYLCSSNFLWKTEFNKIISLSESCATSEGWLACYGGDSE